MAARRVRPGAPPDWLYVFIVAILGVTLLMGVVSWVWLTFEHEEMPDGLATVLATIAGGLVGALTMEGRGPRRDRGDRQRQSDEIEV